MTQRSEVKESVYSVYNCGPVLCGRVAVFRSKLDADRFCTQENTKSMFSPTAKKNRDGVSKAYLMGDGRHWVQEEQMAKSLFEWY